MVIFHHGIIRIIVREKQRYNYAKIITQRVGPLFGKKTEKKFYKELWSSPVPIEEVELNNGYIDGDSIYWYPNCVIKMSDGGEKCVYFKTVADLEKFVDELKSKAPHIIV